MERVLDPCFGCGCLLMYNTRELLKSADKGCEPRKKGGHRPRGGEREPIEYSRLL